MTGARFQHHAGSQGGNFEACASPVEWPIVEKIINSFQDRRIHFEV